MSTNQTIEVTDCGAIKRIVPPPGWTERESGQVKPDGRFVRTFCPPDSPQAHFCLYYRPAPISLESGKNLLEILVAPFHDLAVEEIALLRNVLEGMAVPEAFEIASAGTGYLNGKRVIRIVGLWKQLGTKTMSAITNGEESGCVVQQIYYSAPEQEFDRYLNAASDAMLSVEWN